MTSQRAVSIYIEQSLFEVIDQLAKKERRSVSNFISQFLRVSLSGDVDTVALTKKLNPALTAGIDDLHKRLTG